MLKKTFQSQLVKDLAPAIAALAITGGAPIAKGVSTTCFNYAGQVYEACVGGCNAKGISSSCLELCDQLYGNLLQFCS
jgi:hypothetical protein